MNDDLIELLKLIEARPALYLSRNTISALRAFIDGWLLRRPDDVINFQILKKIQKYVENNFEIDGRFPWDRIILLFSEDENDALKLFFKIFNEVCEKSQRP